MARGSWRPENLCRTCYCNPCQCTEEQIREGHRQRNVERVRGQEPITTPKKKKSKRQKPKLSKQKFIANLRSKNPSISDYDIKKALKKAGYPVGCAIIAILTLTLSTSGVIWGTIEAARIIWG